MSETNSQISISPTQGFSHANNWSALFGFDHDKGEEYINSALRELYFRATTYPPYAAFSHGGLYATALRDNQGADSPVQLRIVLRGGEAISIGPFLQTNQALPFRVKHTEPWSSTEEAEATIEGAGAETFGLKTHVVDFGANREVYTNTDSFALQVAGLVLTLRPAPKPSEEEGAPKFADNFCAFMPESSIQDPGYYNFIGTIIHSERIELEFDVKGYLLRLRLINAPEGEEELFVVDVFVNDFNIAVDDLTVGRSVSGVVWFVGCVG